MAFFPYERFVIISKLKPADLEEKLTPSIGRYKFKFYNSHDESAKPYNGYISRGGFEITRNIQYKNSFLPQISGTIRPDITGGSIIEVKMTMHIIVILFMIIWLGATGIGGITMMIAALINGNFHPSMLTVIGMFAFGYCLSTFSFKYESKIATEFLLKETQGDIE